MRTIGRAISVDFADACMGFCFAVCQKVRSEADSEWPVMKGAVNNSSRHLGT